MNRKFKIAAWVLFGLSIIGSCFPPTAKAQDRIAVNVSYFPLQDTRLLLGPFYRAQQVDEAYMMKLSPDRLLAPYLTEAGIPAKAKNYGNWESSGLDGHIAGHYLSALSMMYASTGDKRLLDRLNYMVGELKRCQDHGADGYLGGIPDGRAMWKKVAAGDVKAVNSRWVPWYNLHKLFAGLRDAYRYTGSDTARAVLIRLSDWCLKETSGLSDTQMQTMLQTESGGMNEVLADVAAITGEKKYLTLAERFSKRSLLNPLLKDTDALTGLHANTQIPVVIGFERIADLSGNRDWHRAAEFFWQTVVHHRTVAFGGNSVKEHFNPVNDFSGMITSPQGPETCNTYNMLKLTRMLYEKSGDPAYMDYYERALYNHILSSENLDQGGFVYFTPLRPEHYRVFSRPETSFWCCVGTGMENHSKYGGTIYAHTKDALLVNLFIASRVKWKEKGLVLTQQTRFPDADRSTLEMKLSKPATFTLKIRYPGWVAPGALRLRVNGKAQTVTATPDSYVSLTRQWKSGDQVEVTLPMTTTMTALPDHSAFVALMEGPIVLAARTGNHEEKGEFADTGRFAHIASGPRYPLEDAPMLLGARKSILADILPVPGDSLAFTAAQAIYPARYKELKLIPFFRIGGYRYMMYWQHTTAQGLSEAIREDKKLDARR